MHLLMKSRGVTWGNMLGDFGTHRSGPPSALQQDKGPAAASPRRWQTGGTCLAAAAEADTTAMSVVAPGGLRARQLRGSLQEPKKNKRAPGAADAVT
eukprot:COSAG04_NODE_3759_length_2552_cov_2.606925_5_plen_97_part_00